MNAIIQKHFQESDPHIYSLIQSRITKEPIQIQRSKDYFVSLCREIIGQQLSTKAASSIFARFEALVPDKTVTPPAVHALTEEHIRGIGTSWAKARFIKDAARQIIERSIILEELDHLSDADVIEALTKIKGVGPWTAEMFLMFTLGREDVFSHGDQGLKNAMKKVYGWKKIPSKRTIERITKKWSPYRTYACLLLWESLDAKPINK